MSETPKGEARLGMGGNNPPHIGLLVNDALPTLPDEIKARHPKIFEDFKSVERRLKLAKPPESEADCVKLTKLIADAQDVLNDAETARADEKKPFFEAGKVADSIFNTGVRDALGKLKDPLAKEVAKFRAAEARRIQQEQAEAAAKAQAEALKHQERGEQQDDAGRIGAADISFSKAEAAMQEANSLRAQASAPLAAATKTDVAGVRSSASVKMICTGIIRENLDLEKLRPFLKEADLIAAVNAYLKANPTGKVEGAALAEDFNLRVGRRG